MLVNLFTVPLQNQLKTLGYNGTGRLGAKRLDASCPFSSVYCFDKNERGSSQTVTGWKDPPFMGRTLLTKSSAGVRRNQIIGLPIPQTIYNYNQNM